MIFDIDDVVLGTSKLLAHFDRQTDGTCQISFKVTNSSGIETTYMFTNDEWKFLLLKEFQTFLSNMLERFADGTLTLNKMDKILGTWEISETADTICGNLSYSLLPKGLSLVIDVTDPLVIHFDNGKSNVLAMSILEWNNFKTHRKRMFNYLFSPNDLFFF